MLAAGVDGLMVATCRDAGAQAGEAIGEHCAPRGQVLPGPWVPDASELNQAPE